jgi:hypothetical protein
MSDECYTLPKLIERLQEIQAKYQHLGEITVRMLTETEATGQVEQPVADCAVTMGKAVEGPPSVILLPPNF